MNFSLEDSRLVIRALDLLQADFSAIKNEVPLQLFDRIKSVRNRFRLGIPGFTPQELDTVCVALESLLESEPMNWAASQLLYRLQSYLQPYCK